MKRTSPIAAMTSDPEMARHVMRLRALPMPALLEEYERVWGKPPRVKHRDYLWKRIAWKIQETKSGGLSAVAKARLEELIAQLGIDFGDRSVAGVRQRSEPTKGSILRRSWRGQDIEVRVVDGGFEWDGRSFTSLSAVATAITGARWNGRLFFGLTTRKKSS